MSDSTFPFEPAGSEPLGADETSGDSRRPLLLVGGLVGALVLGAGGFLLLGGDGGDAELALGTASPAPAAAAPIAEPEAIAAAVPAAASETVGRNPFKARYVAPVGSAEGSASSAEGAGSSVGGLAALPDAQPSAPAQLPSGSSSVVVVQQPPSAAPKAPAPAEYPLTLKELGSNEVGVVYTWSYDGQDVAVNEVQRFGRYGELVVVGLRSTETGPEARLQVGDDSPVWVKVGETVNVL